MPKKEQTIPLDRVIATAKFSKINDQKIHMQEGLVNELVGRSVAIFVSILSDAFRPPELDAMLAALYHKGVQQIDLVVVDGLQGLNLVSEDCSTMNKHQIRENVFPEGEKAARQWVTRAFSILKKYNDLSMMAGKGIFVRPRYCSVRQLDDFNLESTPEYQLHKTNLTALLGADSQEARNLRAAINDTVEIYMRNRTDPFDMIRDNAQRYIELELAYYAALAELYNFIAYPNTESKAFNRVRMSIPKEQRASYIEFLLDRKDEQHLTQASKDKIMLTGGVSAVGIDEYDRYKLQRHSSVNSIKDGTKDPRSRSRSLNCSELDCQNSKLATQSTPLFHVTGASLATIPPHSPRLFKPVPVPDSPPRINAAVQIRNGNFAAALQLLLAAGEPAHSVLIQKMQGFCMNHTNA
jgi:hypothetical protein